MLLVLHCFVDSHHEALERLLAAVDGIDVEAAAFPQIRRVAPQIGQFLLERRFDVEALRVRDRQEHCLEPREVTCGA